MQAIIPRQRFTLVASALSGTVLVGTVLALGFADVPDGGGAPAKFTDRLRPAQQPDAMAPDVMAPDVRGPDVLAWNAIAVPAPQPVARRSATSLRFAFVPPEIGILGDPAGDDGAVDAAPAADPDSWAVDIRQRPAPQSAAPRKTARSGFGQPETPKARRRKPRRGHYTLGERLAEIAPAAKPRLAQRFAAANAPWPPEEVAMVAIKDEKALELHARSKAGKWTFVHRYKVLAASGGRGPKLARGDRQVPEGIYRITYLNPNSRYHVSLRVNYPNAFDRKMARKDKRRDLGGDIMIHGKRTSAGCLAMGDPAAEELFVLAAEVGKRNIKLIIAPTDFRTRKPPKETKGAEWVAGLYAEVATAMAPFERPKPPSLLSLLGL